MTAPARTRTPASQTRTTEREHFPQSTGTEQATLAPTPTRRRSGAGERGYARREKRRAYALREGTERRDRRQQRGRVDVDEPQPQRVRQPREQAGAKRLQDKLQDKVVGSRVPLVVGVMVLLATGLAATLWLAIAAISGSYQLQQAQAQVNTLTDEKQQLLEQNSNLDSTPALQQRAAAQGMVPAPEPAHLVPQPDSSVAVIGQPDAAAPGH